jgi:hypothetical protein
MHICIYEYKSLLLCVCVCNILSQSLSAGMNPVSLKFLLTVRAELPILRPECGSFPYQQNKWQCVLYSEEEVEFHRHVRSRN